MLVDVSARCGGAELHELLAYSEIDADELVGFAEHASSAVIAREAQVDSVAVRLVGPTDTSRFGFRGAHIENCGAASSRTLWRRQPGAPSTTNAHAIDDARTGRVVR
jgi:hypothetical protein